MIFYGINPLFEALHSESCPRRILVQQGKSNKRIQGILHLAERKGIPVETVADLKRLCGSAQHQGVAAEIPGLGQQPLTDQAVLGDRIVMLDSIQDPHNFGAAMRVCEAFGFRDIIYHKGNSSGVTPTVVKVSTGAIFHVRLLMSNLNRAVKWLKAHQYRLCVLEGGGERTIYDVDFTGRFCIVIGSEGSGVRHNIRREADRVMRIPMQGRVNSLNVSCALSAVLAEVSRRGV